MKYRLWTILWAFALLASAMATFGGFGILPAIVVFWFWGLTLLYGAVSRRAAILTCLFTDLAIFFIPGLILGAREAHWSPRATCAIYTKNIGLALNFYAQVHGHFPPAYQVGPDGKPWHSWRVLILPYIDEQDLYDQYDFNEPWDGPNNRKLWDKMPLVYRCPGFDEAARLRVFDSPPCETNYFAVVGPQTAWRGDDSVDVSDVTDGLSNTLLILESSKSACWLEPTDLSYDEAVKQLTIDTNTGHHRPLAGLFSSSSICRGRMSAFADGTTEFLPNCMSKQAASAVLSINGGEDFDPSTEQSDVETVEGFGPTFFNWRFAYPLASLLILSHMPLMKLLRKRESAPLAEEVIG